MSKKRKVNSSRRDTFSRITSGRQLISEPLPIKSISLTNIEDNRRFTPDSYRPARSLNQMRAPIKVRLDPRKKPTLTQVFADPLRTIVCIRRKMRKEVLHAAGVAGSRVRRGRYNEKSNISCKG